MILASGKEFYSDPKLNRVLVKAKVVQLIRNTEVIATGRPRAKEHSFPALMVEGQTIYDTDLVHIVKGG